MENFQYTFQESLIPLPNTFKLQTNFCMWFGNGATWLCTFGSNTVTRHKTMLEVLCPLLCVFYAIFAILTPRGKFVYTVIQCKW